MSSGLGLAELLLVLLGVMGWGAYELWWLDRGRRSTGDRKAASGSTKRKAEP